MNEDEGFYEFTPDEMHAEEHGLSIWHWHKTDTHYDWAEVELASGNNFKFPADKNGLQSFNDYSGVVNSRKRDSTLSDVAINDIDVNILFHPYTFEVILDVIDPAPQTPANFAGTIYNNHPKVTWSLNSEPYIAGYEIYRNITGNYYLLGTVNASTSYFVDNEVGLGGPIEGIVSYKIRAKDHYPNYSNYTNPVSYRYHDFSPYKVVVSAEIYDYKLNSNFPNPFNPSTEITYSLAQDADVTLRVYDILGTQIAQLVNEQQTAGSYSVNFNADNLSSGVYFYRIVASKNERILFTDVKQMILLR